MYPTLHQQLNELSRIIHGLPGPMSGSAYAWQGLELDRWWKTLSLTPTERLQRGDEGQSFVSNAIQQLLERRNITLDMRQVSQQSSHIPTIDLNRRHS